jgi:chromosomal replication initiator protein
MVTKEQILSAVSEIMGVEKDDLLGRRRPRILVVPRHLAMYVLHEIGQLSYPSIGRMFFRDHSSVLHGCRNAECWLEHNQQTRDDYERILRRLATMQVAA